MFGERMKIGRKILEIGIQPLFVILALIGQKEESKGFQPPDQHVQPLEHPPPVKRKAQEVFPVEVVAAQDKIPQLLWRPPDQRPVAALPDDPDQSKHIE